MSRFLAVVFPVSSLSYRTVPVARLAILVTWTLTLTAATPLWLAHHTIQIENGGEFLFNFASNWLHRKLTTKLNLSFSFDLLLDVQR